MWSPDCCWTKNHPWFLFNRIFQQSKKSPTGPTERTPKPRFFYSSIVTFLGVRWDSVPFNFWWNRSSLVSSNWIFQQSKKSFLYIPFWGVIYAIYMLPIPPIKGNQKQPLNRIFQQKCLWMQVLEYLGSAAFSRAVQCLDLETNRRDEPMDKNAHVVMEPGDFRWGGLGIHIYTNMFMCIYIYLCIYTYIYVYIYKPKTSMEPENCWFVDVFPFSRKSFQIPAVSFRVYTVHKRKNSDSSPENGPTCNLLVPFNTGFFVSAFHTVDGRNPSPPGMYNTCK